MSTPGRLRQLLDANAARRAAHAATPGLATRLGQLRAWQSARLRDTYADLAAEPRYTAAVSYFIDELYGGADLEPRDQDLKRAAGALERLLPQAALGALEDSIELEMQTQALDAALAAALPPDEPVERLSYAVAYRRSAPRLARREQLSSILRLGATLERLVATPGLGMLLRLTRAPARAAGLGGLQRFLERGYAAFTATGGAQEFLTIIAARESQLMEGLYQGDATALGEIRS